MIFSTFIGFLPLFIAIILHEIAHGYAAYLLGDDTAQRYGRLTLNPIRHVDLFGTILLPAMLILSKSGFIFGWAKPVPVDFAALKHQKIDIIIVASAGIITNILLAMLSSILLNEISYIDNPLYQGYVGLFLINMIVFNVLLAVFNVLPIPPLDGSKILFGWISNSTVQKFLDSDKNGMAFIITAAFIIPAIGSYFGQDWNFFGDILVKTANFFIKLLM